MFLFSLKQLLFVVAKSHEMCQGIWSLDCRIGLTGEVAFIKCF